MWRLKSKEFGEQLFHTLPDLMGYMLRQPQLGNNWNVRFIPVGTKPEPQAAAMPLSEEPKAGLPNFPVPLSRLKEDKE